VKKVIRNILIAGGIATLALVLSGCDANPPKAALAIIGQVGGKCAEGICETQFTVYDDGTTSDPEIDFDVTPLVNAIEESNLRESSIDPNGFCQSYVDGRDLTIQVPAWDEEVYSPCKFLGGADDPLTIVAQDMFYKLNREIT